MKREGSKGKANAERRDRRSADVGPAALDANDVTKPASVPAEKVVVRRLEDGLHVVRQHRQPAEIVVAELRPGVRENEIVALANKRLYEMGSDQVEAINAISGERCNPHPHNFTDRLIRPGDQAFFDIIHSFNGYRTCYYRTFAVGSATPSQRDAYTQGARVDGRVASARSGPASAPTRSPRVWPKAEEFGFDNEMAAFGLQFGHGLGLGLHERPIISRLNSMKEPVELQAGMVFALETYCPASDGFSAARIEEEVVVTDDGPRILTLFPAAGPRRHQPLLTGCQP